MSWRQNERDVSFIPGRHALGRRILERTRWGFSSQIVQPRRPRPSSPPSSNSGWHSDLGQSKTWNYQRYLLKNLRVENTSVKKFILTYNYKSESLFLLINYFNPFLSLSLSVSVIRYKPLILGLCAECNMTVLLEHSQILIKLNRRIPALISLFWYKSVQL